MSVSKDIMSGLESVLELLENQSKEESKPSRAQLIDFFNEHPNPSDAEVHSFSEQNGFDTHETEAAIYKLATERAKELSSSKNESVASVLKKQGKSKSNSDDDYNAIELEIGTKVEYEHTPNTVVSKEIAKDHLEENPLYYTKALAKVEPDVLAIAKQVVRKHGYKNLKDYWSDHE